MIHDPISPFWSQIRLPEARRGALPVARRDVLKIGGLAIGAAAAVLTGCAGGDGQAPVEAGSPASTGFFTDGTNFVD